ncbi:MAG: hypothetical protein WDM85_10190 [Caulobacteraceae bacterium]
MTRFGYLIEDVGDVAYRNQRQALTAAPRQLTAAQLDPHAAARAALFEFMIGNLDWDFLAGPAGADCCHNSKPIAALGATPRRRAGHSALAVRLRLFRLRRFPLRGPPEGIPIDRITDRFYRGYCVSSGEIASVIDEYRARRAEMTAVINGETRLTPQFRDKTLRFMDGFFALLDDPARVQREIVKHCSARRLPSRGGGQRALVRRAGFLGRRPPRPCPARRSGRGRRRAPGGEAQRQLMAAIDGAEGVALLDQEAVRIAAAAGAQYVGQDHAPSKRALTMVYCLVWRSQCGAL